MDETWSYFHPVVSNTVTMELKFIWIRIWIFEGSFFRIYHLPTFECIKETLAKLYRKDLCRSFAEVFGQTTNEKDIWKSHHINLIFHKIFLNIFMLLPDWKKCNENTNGFDPIALGVWGTLKSLVGSFVSTI